jgi:pyruvyltransferase
MRKKNCMFRLYNKIRETLRVFNNTNKTIVANWSNSFETKNNWGDALNSMLINKISGKEVIHVSKIINLGFVPVYSVVGSTLDKSSKRNLEIWGSGFKTETSNMKRLPKKVHAVRGPLTRKRLIELGVKCPTVYGDPALLCPEYFPPTSNIKKYNLGIIPHYVDKDHPWLKIQKNQSDAVIIIDIQSGIQSVIDLVNSCKYIASSSLHGLILSDAFGIPSRWLRFSDKIIGGSFKFLDYFLSVDRYEENPMIISIDSKISDIGPFYNSKITRGFLDNLKYSCPILKS